MWKSIVSRVRVAGVTSTSRLQTQLLLRTFSQAAEQEVIKDDSADKDIDNPASRVKIAIPSWAVGTIIGVKRGNIEKLKRDCKTSIRISDYGDYFPGSSENVCLIEGDSENVVDAVHKISDSVRNTEIPEFFKIREGAEYRQRGVKLIFPISLSGLFIGKGGEDQRKIKERFSLEYFSMQRRNTLTKDSIERSIFIKGEVENMRQAVNFVIEKLESNPDHKLGRNISYRNIDNTERETETTAAPQNPK